MINWTIKTLPIKDLKDHSRNPRKITKQKQQHLQNLIEKYGLIDKPIINLDMTIIGGHQRIKILKKMKIKEVECSVPDRILEQEDIDELCIGLNLHQGSFDNDILANEWDLIDLIRYGFTEEQLLGSVKEMEDNITKETEKKKKSCPHCGHEL